MKASGIPQGGRGLAGGALGAHLGQGSGHVLVQRGVHLGSRAARDDPLGAADVQAGCPKLGAADARHQVAQRRLQLRGVTRHQQHVLVQHHERLARDRRAADEPAARGPAGHHGDGGAERAGAPVEGRQCRHHLGILHAHRHQRGVVTHTSAQVLGDGRKALVELAHGGGQHGAQRLGADLIAHTGERLTATREPDLDAQPSGGRGVEGGRHGGRGLGGGSIATAARGGSQHGQQERQRAEQDTGGAGGALAHGLR